MDKIEPFEIEEKKNHKKSFLFKYKIYILLSIIIVGLLVALIVIVTLPEKKNIASSNSSSTDIPSITTDSIIVSLTSVISTTTTSTTTSSKTTTSTTTTSTTTASTTTASTTTASTTTTSKTTTSTTTTSTTTASTTITSTRTTTKAIIDENSRINCFPDLAKENVTKEKCDENTLCIYDLSVDPDTPSCYYDINQQNNILINTSVSELGEIHVIQIGNSRSGSQLKVEFEQLDDTVLRFKISKFGEKEYEVPIEVNKPNLKAKNPLYEVKISTDNNKFNFKIIRKSTGTVLWDTSLAPIIYDKFFKQIATRLPSINIYGMGENMHESFRHNLKYQSWPVFARDQIAEDVKYSNLYGSQPFYTVMENDGNSHGVVLVNSNAFDYELIPSPGIIYRVTGGVLDFYLFMGPGPENVVQKYTDYFGKTFMPPYWALGFQISRYGYENLDDMKEVLKRFQDNNIPLDTQVADIDHYDERKDFTIDPVNWNGLSEYFDYLHDIGMKTVMILDPALVVDAGDDYWPYQTGLENDVFIRWPNDIESPDYNYTNSSIMLGYCWPNGRVAYPDFFKNSTKKWWIDSIQRHHDNISFDGIWIDMNEPAVFGTNEEKPFNWPEDRNYTWSLKCPDNEYENVRIKASYLYDTDTKKNKLSDKTLCMVGVQGENDNTYKHFDVHNLYGYMESIPSFEASRQITGTRGFVITRSTFIGNGKYGGHWTGDNNSLWTHLKYSIIGMLEFNLFGIPYVGADICGFFYNTTEQLCARWSSLGAFYPFSRNHNSEKNIPQDPGYLGEPVISAARNALNIRYEILPYYYTLFYKAHTRGNTVARPLFHEFPMDNNTYSIDEQFLIGPAFLVSPILRENETSVDAYFAADLWYDYHNGTIAYNNYEKGEWITLYANYSEIPLHIRSGYIIPTQNPANTTKYARKNPFGLIVALNNDNEAIGDLFYDDGESQNVAVKNYYLSTFIARDNKLEMHIEYDNYKGSDQMILDTIRLLHNKKYDSSWVFILNKKTVIDSDNITFSETEIVLSNLGIPMSDSFVLEWSNEFPLHDSPYPIIDCSIQNKSITRNDCEAKNCSYDDSQTGRPFCFIPQNIGGYSLLEFNSVEEYNLTKNPNFSLFGNDEVQNLAIKVTHGYSGQYQTTRLQIIDQNDKDRYQVPVPLNFNESKIPYLNITVGESLNNMVYIEVKNQLNNVLFDTINAENGLIFSDQFIQIVFNLGYKNVYGFGENTHTSFKHKFSNSNWWALFGRDQPTGGQNINLYGVHPFFMAVDEKTSRAFGVLILNSNAQEYGFIPPASLNYRTLGGILDFYIMEEASPEELVRAYSSLIGLPYFPPYWSLGFQLCRYGYNSLDNMKAALNRTIEAKIPIDIQYADIDHFDRNLDFTYDKENFDGLPEYIEGLQSKGMKFIIILDPAINSEEPNYKPFLEGKDDDIYIKWPADQNPQWNETSDQNGTNNTYIIGYVWPEGKTVFPDFLKEKTKNWWSNQIERHYNEVLKFDGLWIDMNEPANFDTNLEKPFNWPANKTAWNLFCPNNKYDDPPYLPLAASLHGRKISDKTICMRGMQGEDDKFKHYDVHNLYGWSQTEPTLKALRKTLNKRSIVISRSTYPSSGHFAGHWLGDNNSKWSHLKYNIIGMLEFNLFGIPYIGADICGFDEDTTPEMCTRWMQIGAFNTFFRNHNGKNAIDQDPAVLGVNVAAASRKIVEIRYSLLPYLYSLFYEVNQKGGTVIRSLMHEFTDDKRTYEIDRQFMWGSALMISPVLDQNKRTVYAYFPKTRWFDFYTGEEIEQTGRIHELDAPLDHLPLHVRGGSIIFTQEPALNTHYSRLNPYGLIIACGDGNQFNSRLFIDDGDDIDYVKNSTIIEFEFNEPNAVVGENFSTLKINVVKNNYNLAPTNTLDTIRVLGLPGNPSRPIEIIGASAYNHTNFTFNPKNKELVIRGLKLSLETTDIQYVTLYYA